jgi:hypothetical protein
VADDRNDESRANVSFQSDYTGCKSISPRLTPYIMPRRLVSRIFIGLAGGTPIDPFACEPQ